MRLYSTILLLAIFSLSFSVLNDWEIFQSEKGNFQIEMPELPAVSSQVLQTSLGDIKMNVFMHEGEADIDDNILYMLSYTDYPTEKVNAENMDKESLNKYYEDAVKGSVNNLDGVLKSEETIDIFGHEGRSITVNYMESKAIMKMQILLVKNRMYAIQVIALAENDNNESQNRFFNSFELIPE